MKIAIAYRANSAFRGYIPRIIETLKKDDHEVKEVYFAEGVPEKEVKKHLQANMHLIVPCTLYFSDSICAVGKFKDAINIDWLTTVPPKTTELQVVEQFTSSIYRPL